MGKTKKGSPGGLARAKKKMNTSLIDHQKALEAVTADRLPRKNGYCEVPTAVFISEVDVNMPALPAVAFYVWPNGRTQPEVLKKSDQPYSPLALSQNPRTSRKSG